MKINNTSWTVQFINYALGVDATDCENVCSFSALLLLAFFVRIFVISMVSVFSFCVILTGLTWLTIYELGVHAVPFGTLHGFIFMFTTLAIQIILLIIGSIYIFEKISIPNSIKNKCEKIKEKLKNLCSKIEFVNKQ